MTEYNKKHRDEWTKRFLAEVGKEDLLEAAWNTPEGITLKPLYTKEDLENIAHQDTWPGAFPYLRGSKASMYVGRPWTIRQYSGFSTAEESNAFYRKNLIAGQTGLSVAFDLPTHRGYDSDHERVIGDVGKAGGAIDSVEDMKSLFEGIPLDEISVSMTMNGAVLPILAMYVVAAEEQNTKRHHLRGTLQNDILKEFMVRNTYIYPPGPSMRIVSDIIRFTSGEMPRFNPISISGYHMQEAGATVVQELAYTLADGLEYIRAALAIGLHIDDFAPRLSFFFGIGMNFFMEIAKLRAARQLWSQLVSREFQAKDRRSLMLRTHCQTSGVSLASKDPYNNIVRTTIEALAGVLGGTQSLHTNSFDEALGLPTEFASQIARNTQLIMREEMGLTKIVDPLGGSYYVEALTHSIVTEAQKLISEIEDIGGMTNAVANGLPKLRIEEAAAQRQARIDQKDESIVGVNCFALPDEEVVDIRHIDNQEVRRLQIEKLMLVRATRNESSCNSSLVALENSAGKDDGRLVEYAIDAARARATVGEISQRLENVFGRYRAEIRSISGVYGMMSSNHAEFDELRQSVALLAAKFGRQPRLLVAKLGQDGHDRGAKVVATAFADLGFDVDIGALFQTPEEVARQAIENDVHIIGVSSQVAGHMTLIPELMDALTYSGCGHVLVALGGVIPKQDHQHMYDSGVSVIFDPGTSILNSARKVISLLSGLDGS
ncbi:MAG: methylmalonyl-CoA mutase [Acidiferrobacteraceae bacterium]|nr:methylmalonyl-CoA mutase [Acidiferrobacteraceae bacterium]